MTKLHPTQEMLKAARAEIESVLKKHDIAGFVTLHAPGWGETFWNIWPSHSCLIGDFPAIRVKSKLADYLGNVQVQREHQQNTAGMVYTLGTSMAGCGLQFLELSTMLDAHLGAEHTEKGFTPDPSRFNPGTH
ncbi:hypothetical protein [Ramlibacter sp.]|uniref:hypothetical protein n=1 Tax=Ramlibacter sp. TaxID=1917967 RepID=UPI003D0F7D40